MINTSYQPSRLATKPHFQVLDGLRGIAAISVLIFHFMEFAVPDYSKNLIAHSYLAVDFFFCLSGFVIAYAYDKKIQQLSFWDFFRLRLIRLHPMVIIGALIGVICLVADPFGNLYGQLGAAKTVLLFFSASLLIPYPAVPQRFYNLFHLNPPTWSLMWEYLANIAYALILYRLSTKKLLLLLMGAGLALFVTARLYSHLAVGWGISNALGGVARIGCSFLLGMLVCRLGFRIQNKLGFVPIGLLLLATFFIPYMNRVNWFMDPVLVVVYFPFLIALGAATTTSPFWSSVCKKLGDLSYPLYVIHYPFLWIFLSYVEAEKPSPDQLRIVIPLAATGIIILAYLILTYVDVPIRRYLVRQNTPKPVSSAVRSERVA